MVHGLRAWGWLQEVLGAEAEVPAGLLIHAFGGAPEMIQPLAARGAYFSFAASALRPHSRRPRAAAAAVPLDRLLVETDSPDIPLPPGLGTPVILLPDGRRRTEPAHAALVLEGVAALRSMPVSELAAAVMDNARRLLGPLAPELPAATVSP